jgi:hypothetical protein
MEGDVTASDDLWDGIKSLRDSRHAYDKADAYYEGTAPEVFSSVRVQRAMERTGIDFDLNFACTVVDAVVDRLEIAAVTSPDDTQAEALQGVWDSNGMDLEAGDVHRRACEFGDAYLIVLPAADENDTVQDVQMFYNSPTTVRVIYDEENPREKRYAIKKWCEGKTYRAELYYPDRIERWTTRPDSQGTAERDWMPWLATPEDDGEPDPESWLIDHDYGEIPVFHFRTDRPFGAPEHKRAYGPQNAINKLIATHMATVDYQGFPQRYALTEAATTDTGDLDPSDFDDDFFPPDPESGPTDSGDTSALKAGPGEVMLLRGFKAVGQFDAAQPNVFLDPVMFNVRAMAQSTTTPLHLFDPQGDAPSGESLRAKEAPFTKKIRNRQLSFGGTWQDVFTFALRLLGFEEPVVDVRWAAASATDDRFGWLAAEQKTKLGVPLRQVLVEGGYTDDQVEAWLEESTDDAAQLRDRLADLASFADSLQKIGSAVTLNAIDQGQAQQLIDPLIQALTTRPAIVPPDGQGA